MLGSRYAAINNSYNFGNIPVKETLGRVCLLTNTNPKETGDMMYYIHGVVSSDNDYIKVFPNYTSSTKKNKIESTTFSPEDHINHNKLFMTAIFPTINGGISNILKPKTNIYNPDHEDASKYGVQFVFMNYQVFDKEMESYNQKFLNNNLILKSDNLRFIPIKGKPIIEQEKHLSYAPRTITKFPGFALATQN